jgi:isocitrate dehydrogenase
MSQLNSKAPAAVSAAAGVKTPVAVAHGDGIGPEIMDAVLEVLEAADAPIEPRPIAIGKGVYESGVTSGIGDDAWATIHDTKLILKAPITTPRGGGYKSLNVTTRKMLGLFANVRPCASYHPFIPCAHPGMDVVIVRENEEDTYGGIEHRQTAEVTQCLKLITRPGSERIIRYAFDFARANGRKKVTCLTKSNIMKITDGLFEKVFNEVAEQYPDIEADHMIIDIGAAKLADDPERFDVVVLPNLYGDIVSDIAAEVAGSVGLAGSANIGGEYAMFEAIHGSAPDIAGQGIANPSGLLQAAVMMLGHLGHAETARTIHNAWLKTIEDGIHTADIYDPARSARRVGTAEFAEAVIERIGQQPIHLNRAACGGVAPADVPTVESKPTKTIVGVDVFADWDEPGRNPADLAQTLSAAGETAQMRLTMITNRGTKVWPGELPATMRTDHWRCRFTDAGSGQPVTHQRIVGLLGAIAERGIDFIKTEHLCEFDGQPGYSKGQGE